MHTRLLSNFSLRQESFTVLLSFFSSLLFFTDVCRTPTQIPKFDWITKYQKDTRGQEVVKQALAPIGTTLTKLNQHGKTGFSPYLICMCRLPTSPYAIKWTALELVHQHLCSGCWDVFSILSLRVCSFCVSVLHHKLHPILQMPLPLNSTDSIWTWVERSRKDILTWQSMKTTGITCIFNLSFFHSMHHSKLESESSQGQQA